MSDMTRKRQEEGARRYVMLVDMREEDRAFPSAREVVLAWRPGTADVRIVPWPDTQDITRDMRTALACHAHVRGQDFEGLKTQCFIDAMHLIVRDGCDPKAVHKALLGVREYRDGCAGDMLSAT